jgi:Tol biopolymer transport system component
MTQRLIRPTLLLCAVCALLLIASLWAGRTVSTPRDFLSYNKLVGSHYLLYVHDPARDIALPLSRLPIASESPIAWSNDGRVAFVTGETPEQHTLRLLDLRTWQATVLLEWPGALDAPVWSRDGQLAYNVLHGGTGIVGNWDIHRYDFAAGRSENLTATATVEFDPQWLPDGRLSFTGIDDSGALDIYLLDLDTRERTKLLPRGQNSYVRWSEDGRGLFRGGEGGNSEVMLYEQGRIRNLTNHPAIDSNAVWSRDGRIAFVSYRDGNQDVFVLDLDSGELTNVSQAAAPAYVPRWSSDGWLTFTVLRASGGVAFFDLYAVNSVGEVPRQVDVNTLGSAWWRWPHE